MRVARFLREDFREQDLTSTLLFLRNETRGIESMRAVGDLLAHQGEINKPKGYITIEAQGFCDNVANVIHWYEAKQKPTPTPARFLEGLEASLNRLTDKALKKHTGLSKLDAEKLFPILKQRLIDGGGKFDGSPREVILMRFLHSTLSVKPRFNDVDVARDFQTLLKKSGVAEVKLSKRAKTFLTLFVLSKMHNTVVKVAGYDPPFLLVHDWGGSLVCSIFTTHYPFPERAPGKIVTHFFDTCLPTEQFVEVGALQTKDGVSRPVEVGLDLKLRAIV